jgi:hypothetical protein
MMQPMQGEGTLSKATTPIEEMLGTLRERAERVNFAINGITERLQGVLRPEDAAVSGENIGEVRRMASPYLEQLMAIDAQLVGFADRINELRDRLDV